MKISKQQLYAGTKAINREEHISSGNLHFKHKVHRSKKSYNRQQNKRTTIF